MWISGQYVFSRFEDADVEGDIDFQYLQVWMFKIMSISANPDANIWSTSIRGGPVVWWLAPSPLK